MNTSFAICAGLLLTSLLGTACTATDTDNAPAVSGDAGAPPDGSADADRSLDSSPTETGNSDATSILESGVVDGDGPSTILHDAAPSTATVGADGRFSLDIVSPSTCDFNKLVGEWVHCAVPRTTLIASSTVAGSVVTSMHTRIEGNCSSTYLPTLTLEASNLAAGTMFRIADRDGTLAAPGGATISSLTLTEAAPWPYVHYDAICKIVLDIVLNAPGVSDDAG